jgi:ribosomal protein S18 acetylase RimI-like enzyme
VPELNDTEKNIKVVMNYEALTEPQKVQFKQVVMEGLKEKFIKALKNDTDSMLAMVDVGIKYGFLPMSKSFCAVDISTDTVLAILALNDFIKPSPLKIISSVIGVIRSIGIKKALGISSGFIALDNMNKEENPKNIKAEIYLVSTSESQRGKGIGTMLMKYVLAYLHSEYESELIKNPDCKVKLLVFEKNPAIRLYGRLGFQQVSSVATPKMAETFGSSYDVLVRMEKPL